MILLPSALYLVACGPSSQPRPRSGPYVQQVTSQTAVVAVVTPNTEKLLLRYGQTGSELAGTVQDRESVEIHGLQATALEPATAYSYEIQSLSGAPLGSGTFRTAPPGNTERCVFLALGDSGGTEDSHGSVVDDASQQIDRIRGAHDDENQQQEVVAAMLGRQPDLILHTGDVVYPAGAAQDYPQAFFEPFGPLIAKVPLYATLGNHDVKTAGGRPFLETFFAPTNGPEPDGRIYSFDWGAAHFVCLDVVSSSFEEGSQQLRWLDRDLAQTDRPWRIVFFHIPPFSPTRSGSEALQRTVVPVLERRGVDLVLSGHDHAYARFFPRGSTTYVVTGGGGKSLYRVQTDPSLVYAESVFHFVEGTADARTLTLRAIDATGSIFDEVVIRRDAQ